MPSPREELLLQVARFPESPGVYIMKNAAGTPIYIGKALNLRSRVRSYFSDAHETRAQIPVMLTHLASIDWIATTTESEALILEANLIRRHKPKYNIDLRDDKHYPYIKVTVREPFPRLHIVRKVLPDGARYFGPYTDSLSMKQMATFANKIFRLADCSMTLPSPKNNFRPCINFSMGRCSGACAGKVSREEYRAGIHNLLRFLAGQRNSLLADLETRMKAASQELRFEEAALLRDQSALIRHASRLQQVDLKLPDVNCDVFGLADGGRSCCMAVLHFREGLLMSTDHFVLSRALWDFSPADHDALIVSYYLDETRDVPAEIILPDKKGFDTAALQEWFTGVRKRPVMVAVPQKGQREKLVAMAEKNARLHLIQKSAPSGEEDCRELQKALALVKTPLAIEAFDISNTGESFCVAGMVRFVNGVPDKSGYRRYKIKTVTGQNDFAMMMEAVTRRLTRLQNENTPFPDLLLIDGGLGQLHAAMGALSAFSNSPEIISLAKQEEILFSPALADPVRLPPTHPARRLVERIRNEVHRYAITYHRALRGKQFSGGSRLEKIEGVGPATAKLLIKTFGSAKRVAAATAEEIANVRGVTLEKALRIKKELGESLALKQPS